MIAGRKAATSHRNGRGWLRREPRPDGRTSWAAGPVNHALPPRPWLARRGSFWRPGHHHHVALDRPVQYATRPLPGADHCGFGRKKGRKGGSLHSSQGDARRRPHGRGTRPPIILGEVHARHRARAGGANNWDLGGERNIIRRKVVDTSLGVLHCIGRVLAT